ncbi:MAG TPA: glycosyltransferase [Verrucomicrobiae bacterium]|nr:glycosyltransferase [Verrucomicrobiae bacterium]
MRIVMFYHTLLSDWNHGNAHFLRGIATELLSRGHEVEVYEPEDSWSMSNLLAEHGAGPVREFKAAYPMLDSFRYRRGRLDLETVLARADVVLVHEWNDPALVKRIGEHHARHGHYALLFHDTHHRMATEPEAMARYDLSNYDGVLAYGRVLRDLYEHRGAARKAWTWHEAADTRVFHPRRRDEFEGDLVWIGNWGDGERSAELHEFLIEPCRKLKLKARVHGVRYPETARAELASAGIEYAGWLPNFRVPEVFSRFKVTVHIPRRPYVDALPGIPTIRPFEALACGIPLVTSPWNDSEGLFTPGKDFLLAKDGDEMAAHLKSIIEDPDLAQALSEHAFKTICARHTCAHRVDELLTLVQNPRAAIASAALQPVQSQPA